MRRITLSCLLCLLGLVQLMAQNDYIVKTTPMTENSVITNEEQFVYDNFPMRMLCNWTPGMKFMYLPEPKEMYTPILRSCATNKDVDSGKLKNQILEFVGTEESSVDLRIGTNYTTRFIFECDSTLYYYEVKGMRLDEICLKNPRASINGMVYLGDVDIARELLIGRSFYTKGQTARVDDPNSYSGWREVNLPVNSRVTVTNVGVGSKMTPVKIIFETSNGRSYFLELALSRTNSGMNIEDFQADRKLKYFANAFSFNDSNVNTLESIRKKYVGMPVYPKQTIPVMGNFRNEESTGSVHLLRYTSLRIKDIQVTPPNTLAVLTLEDVNGHTYKVEVDLKYDVVIKNENYFDDLFAFGDIRKKFSYVNEEDWHMIAMGEVKAGMTTDECRLALGNPAQVEIKKDSRFEAWIYPRRVLEFESGRLLRSK